MNVKSIRRKNVLALIQERFSGNKAAFARAIDRPAPNVHRMLVNPDGVEKEQRGIGEDLARDIERKLRLELYALDVESDRMLPNAEEIGPLGPPSTVPVVGTAQLGDDGYWAELEYPAGFGDGRVIAWSADQDAYAIRCRGDSMRPRIQDGEFVVVSPKSNPIPGDEVLIKHIDGRVMVKRFLYERDDRLYLQSVNDAHPSRAFPRADIERFHRVIAILKKEMWLPD